MNILTSWRESLRVLNPQQLASILRYSLPALNVGISPMWGFFSMQLMLRGDLMAYFGIFCDAHLWREATILVATSAVQERIHLLTPQSGFSLVVAGIMLAFVLVSSILKIMGYSNKMRQKQEQKYRQFDDEPLLVVGDNSLKLRAMLMLKIFGVIAGLLFAWVALMGLAMHLASLFHIPYVYVSGAAYFMLMPHAPLKEMSLGSSLGSVITIWPNILSFGVIGSCWPVCVMFFFFMLGGRTSVYTALRNSICMIVRHYPVFFIIRLATHALLMAVALGDYLVLSLNSSALYLTYWYVICYVIVYVGWQCLWQLMFVLYQIWAPQMEQSPQHPQDNHDAQIVSN